MKEYARSQGASDELLQWLSASKYLKTNQPSIDEYEHTIDYLISEKPRLTRLSWQQAVVAAEKWITKLAKQGAGIVELPEDTETVIDFGDGFRIAKLIGENAYKREGALMHHCVASYYGNGSEIYSLRDAKNLPHCTIEKDEQIKGKGNGNIHPKYIEYVVKFLEWSGMTVSDNEMRHLGYINLEKFKRELNDETKSGLFRGYFPIGKKMIGKDGNEFADFELLDQVPLIDEESGQMQFPLNAAIERVISKTDKKKDSGDYAQIGSSGDSAQIGSSGDYAQIGSSGDSAQIGSSGNSTKIGSSGYYAQIGSSGYSTKIGSSGYYAKIGNSGYYAQIGSSGYSAKIGSSGYSAKIGSSGNSTKIGSSGDYAQIGSSGDSAKIGSSGYYAQIDATGEDSVIAAIGYNSKIRGVIGTWITLAEYNSNGKPLIVKSAQIDGKKLKPDTWYKLKNGDFTEVQ